MTVKRFDGVRVMVKGSMGMPAAEFEIERLQERVAKLSAENKDFQESIKLIHWLCGLAELDKTKLAADIVTVCDNALDDDSYCHECKEHRNACGDLYCEECHPGCPDYDSD